MQWIGEVPSHWNPCRFKNFVSLINTPSTDDNKIGLENIESGTGHFKETDSEFEGNGVQFVEDDIVYGKLRPYLRKVWLATNKGNAVGDFFVFRANKSNPSYIHWLMLSDGFTSETNGSTYGAKMPRVSSDFILSMRYVLPPLLEQQAIASFLDAKTKPIDDIIAKREKQIELLEEMKSAIVSRAVTKGLNPNAKMKDSGIEWIGEVPEHWKVAKTLFLLSMPITDGPHETPKLYDCGIPFISAEAISGGEIDFSKMRGYISEEYYKECCKKYIPQIDDIYMIKSGATTGRIAKVKTSEIFTIWSPLAVFRVNKHMVTSDYLYYVLKSDYYQRQVELGWNYGTQQNIGMRTLEKLLVAFPEVEEQRKISSYLDQETIKFDTRIAKRRKQIELLQEYKQALITAAVTGKIDVREYNS